jgi:hypothetical protein
MKKVFILAFVILISIPAFGQFQNQQRRGGDPLRQRMPPQPPSEAQKEDMKRKMEEKMQAFISDFVNSLEVDEFQKEIAKQTISEYFDKVIELQKLPYSNSQERALAIQAMEKEHFTELKLLISEANMKKIKDMISGDYEPEDEHNQKKKKRRGRKTKDESEIKNN